MKKLMITILIGAGLVGGQTAPEATASVSEELRKIRVLLQQQQKIAVALELFRLHAQRIGALEARIDQLDTELSSERKRLVELTAASSAAPADDRAMLTEQYRRANELIAELESTKSRYTATLAAEVRQQDEMLRSGPLSLNINGTDLR